MKLRKNININLKTSELYPRFSSGGIHIYIYIYRHFQICFSKHLGISKTTNLSLSTIKKSLTAVRDHMHVCNHQNTSGSFRIIGSAKDDYHLKIKESLNILRENLTLNKTVKSFPLELF